TLDFFAFGYASTLLKVEVFRSIDRLRLQGKLSDDEVALQVKAFLDLTHFISEVPISHWVLSRASAPFPTVVRTLDAIHLASAWVIQEEQKSPLTFLTHDAQLKRAAQAMGFETVDL
ncbi:MAG: type II toxin-antitoxin system VapC family toxin, partial [Deltaproteobacteria bacterium]|nr:type II toxin-antitoxin system VapC family toxin [Deltaproteobacteria bacterium]